MTLTPEIYIIAASAFTLGTLITWLICSLSKKATVSVLNAQLAAEKKASAEKQSLLQQAETKLSDTFKALSADALKANQEQFLQLAKTTLGSQQQSIINDLDKRNAAVENLVHPVAQSLDKVDQKIAALEKAREGAYASLQQQVKFMAETQQGLQKETAQLVKALRQPTGRGQWGEIQLKKVVEMAGMQQHCDFETQVSTTDADGKRLRPDLVVSLPGGQKIVVDSKVAMSAYLDAIEADDDTKRQAFLTQHAKQVRTHIQQLSSKSYQSQFASTPEFVVLFLPNEAIFSAALTQDPSLIEYGVEKGIILATPTTLIALLRAVAYGWRQETLAQNAQEVASIGRELFSRLCTFTSHIEKVGVSLKNSVTHYNKAVGSLEKNVLNGARKFQDLGAAPTSSVLKQPNIITEITREPQRPAGYTLKTPAPTPIEPLTGGDDFTIAPPEDGFEGFTTE